MAHFQFHGLRFGLKKSGSMYIVTMPNGCSFSAYTVEDAKRYTRIKFANTYAADYGKCKKAKRKKSLADISAQFDRLIKGVSPERFRRIREIESRYRYRILDRFNCVYQVSDRAYYTPVTRRCYAGY
jgi:hypothetical protein